MEPTREMLREAYLEQIRTRPDSSFCRISFESALQDRGLYICLKNLALAALLRRRAANSDERPVLELT